MNDKTKARAGALICATAGAVLCVAVPPAWAQNAPPTSAPATSLASDPNPYYLGASQGFTHDSNVYRIPSGPGDFYSSTSLFGGFDQPISRQHVFGRAAVSLNRYQDETQLNNTSYDLAAGLNWETIQNLSGNLNVALNRGLAAPSASVGVPSAARNIGQTQSIDARARWGGPALLTLEGALGYSKLDYSAPAYAASESRNKTGSLALYYRPGGPLRVGVAGRFTRNETPRAFFDPVSGTYQSNTVDGRNLDLLADYDLTGLLTTNARLSYTRQTNSDVANADFSGLTGSLAVNWRPTAKTTVRFDASREAGFDTTPFNQYGFVQSGTGLVVVPIAGLYENNRVTNSLGLGLTYAATAKISAAANVRYARARLVATSSVAAGSAAPTTTDKLTTASLSANYAITRAWNLGCSLGYETRDVSGAANYSYTANTLGCLTQFVWR